jgi:sterol desaturase/sphingolipid hydroxylase (fatty acid hydroxylase superfamily)
MDCTHNNYGDLPVWDMIFGTFRNPREWNDRCGFGRRESRLAEMLVGKDVNSTQTPAIPMPRNP